MNLCLPSRNVDQEIDDEVWQPIIPDYRLELIKRDLVAHFALSLLHVVRQVLLEYRIVENERGMVA